MSKELKIIISKEDMPTVSHKTDNTKKRDTNYKNYTTKFCGGKCNNQMIHSLESFNYRFHLTEGKNSKQIDQYKLYNQKQKKLDKEKQKSGSWTGGISKRTPTYEL